MIRFLIKRSFALAILLIGASIVIFLLTRALPGEPIAADPRVREIMDVLSARLGVEFPAVARYLDWLAAALRGELGRPGSTGAGEVLMQRLPVTLHLMAASLVLAVVVAVPAGMAAARRKGGIVDRVCRALAFVGAAVPVFWQALVMILVFAVLLRWLPASGYVAPDQEAALSARHMLMPAIVLATGVAAAILCAVRTATIDALGQPHLIVARAAGLSDRAAFWGRVLPRALASALGRMGAVPGQLLAGAVLVETVFDLPGLGRLLVESTRTRDYAAMQGVALASVAAVLLLTLAGDTLRALLDRRARVTS
jgi:peptide/nickel transport system permease protein